MMMMMMMMLMMMMMMTTTDDDEEEEEEVGNPCEQDGLLQDCTSHEDRPIDLWHQTNFIRNCMQ
jgi:hypothetical protein